MNWRDRRGFALFNAIFILVVLAALGTAMVTLSGIGRTTSLHALLGAKAYHAAASGIEWGSWQALNGGGCNGNLTIDGSAVTVICTTTVFAEGGSNYNVHRLSALAEFGAYGDADYVSRRIEARVTSAVP